MKILDFVRAVSDWLEGDAKTLGLRSDLTFQQEWRELTEKFSRLKPEISYVFEGTTGDFLFLKAEVFTDLETDVLLYQTGLERIIENSLLRKNLSHFECHSFHEQWNGGGQLITVFFSSTEKQARKLNEWKAHQIMQERRQAISELRSRKDLDLEEEMKATEQMETK